MTRSKRASGRAAKRKSAVTAGRRTKSSSLGRVSPWKASDSDPSQATFTLREAVQASQHDSPHYWSTNSSKLRNKTMRFVPSTEGRAFEAESPQMPIEVLKPGPTALTTEMEIRSTSPTPSNSSEEVVVFSGRGRVEDNIETDLISSQPVEEEETIEQQHDLVNDEGQNLNLGSVERHPLKEANSSNDLLWTSTGDNWVHREERIARHARRQHTVRSDAITRSKDHPQNNKLSSIKVSQNPAKARSILEGKDQDEDSAGADYIANVEKWEPDIAKAWSAARQPFSPWTKSDLEDFDDLSTSDDIQTEVKQILSKRYREGLKQYLVVWEGQSTDEARWIPHTSLTMQSAHLLIERFEENSALRLEYRDSNKNVGSDEEGSEDASLASASPEEESDDQSDRDEENDRIMHRRMARMTDEQLARLFAKQEELGIHADELLVFDGEVDDDEEYDEETEGEQDDNDEDDNDEDMAIDIGEDFDQKSVKNQLPIRPGFAESALNALEADNYGDFDVMDFDRPSLVKGKRRAQNTVPSFGLSDHDLEQALRVAWAADREKKRLKKREREDLRAQGLLGKRNSLKPDLKAKYSSGLSVQDFRSQLEEFLESDHTTLALPPMDKKDRKMIHTIVNCFKLRSKSQGSGKSRFPIIYKTSKTIQFSDHLFDRVSSKLERQFFPRMDKGKNKGNIPGKRGTAPSGVSYGHGDTVGAGAPELGVENRGRAMLEKMGWTKGDALGALDNQGILQPIAHVVRKSRVGLG